MEWEAIGGFGLHRNHLSGLCVGRYRWLRWKPGDQLGVRAVVQVRNNGAGVEVARRGYALGKPREEWRGLTGAEVGSIEQKGGVKVCGPSRRVAESARQWEEKTG